MPIRIASLRRVARQVDGKRVLSATVQDAVQMAAAQVAVFLAKGRAARDGGWVWSGSVALGKMLAPNFSVRWTWNAGAGPARRTHRPPTWKHWQASKKVTCKTGSSAAREQGGRTAGGEQTGKAVKTAPRILPARADCKKEVRSTFASSLKHGQAQVLPVHLKFPDKTRPGTKIQQNNDRSDPTPRQTRRTSTRAQTTNAQRPRPSAQGPTPSAGVSRYDGPGEASDLCTSPGLIIAQ